MINHIPFSRDQICFQHKKYIPLLDLQCARFFGTRCDSPDLSSRLLQLRVAALYEQVKY
jgi:hypothetical protein